MFAPINKLVLGSSLSLGKEKSALNPLGIFSFLGKTQIKAKDERRKTLGSL
jgi:hypothetical protein